MKKVGPFSVGESLGGLGEYVGQPEDRTARPSTAEMWAKPPMKKGPPKSASRGSKLSKRFLEDRRDMEKVINIPLPSRQFIITPRLISNNPVRLDTGLKDRADIAIWNVSVVAVWINTSDAVAANAGMPLGPSAIGAYNGGAFSADLSEEVKFWGVAASAGQHLVIVMEAAK
jgi:hypothetical protein